MHILLAVIFMVFISSESFASEEVSYQKYFDACGVSGSITLYDLNRNTWVKTDRTDSYNQTLPASTFKIVNSLIALQEEVTSADEIFKWDGIERTLPVWNKNTTLQDAFKNSTVWVYEVLARRIKTETYKKYIRKIPYGNGNIEHGKDGNFWVYGPFAVSPLEQINMLVKLYKNELPFSPSVMDTVKEFMLVSSDDPIKTYGKTGWTTHEGKQIGWWIGYSEFPTKTLFFATRLTKPADQELGDFLSCRKSITSSVIDEYMKGQ